MPGQNSKWKTSNPKGDDREIKILQDFKKAVLLHLVVWTFVKIRWILEKDVGYQKVNQGASTITAIISNKIFFARLDWYYTASGTGFVAVTLVNVFPFYSISIKDQKEFTFTISEQQLIHTFTPGLC